MYIDHRLGGFINSCARLPSPAAHTNVDVRLVYTPGYKDGYGILYEQRQIFFATKFIPKGTEILYNYPYTEGAGIWFEGTDSPKNTHHALQNLRQSFTSRGAPLPDKCRQCKKACAG